MQLPELTSDSQIFTPSPSTFSVIPSASAQKKIDKAIVDQHLVSEFVKLIPDLIKEFSSLALSSDSDSVRLDALKYITDRMAGKPQQDVHHSGAVAQVHVSAEDVQERLRNLLPS